jgi:hypothetical protein
VLRFAASFPSPFRSPHNGKQPRDDDGDGHRDRPDPKGGALDDSFGEILRALEPARGLANVCSAVQVHQHDDADLGGDAPEGNEADRGGDGEGVSRVLGLDSTAEFGRLRSWDRTDSSAVSGLTARDRESIDSCARMLAAIHRHAEMRG